MRSYTIAEIKNSYEQKKDWEKQFPVSRYIFRPLSFAAASVLSRLTNSAEAVAWAGLAAGLAASWFLFDLKAYGPWPGIGGLALFALLDAVDGNLARVTGTVTFYGKMLDGIFGKLAEGIYMPALACGIYRACGDGPANGLAAAFSPLLNQRTAVSWSIAAAGFIALSAMLYSGTIETAYDSLLLQKTPPSAPAGINARIGSSRFRGNSIYALFINLNAFNVQVLLLAAAACFGVRGLVYFVEALAAYYLLRLAVIFVYYTRKASTDLR